MRRMLLLCVALCIGAWAAAQGPGAYNAPGGLPSRPQFQAITIAGNYRCGNTGTSGRQCDLITNGTGATTVGYAGIVDQAGTRYGYWGKSSSVSTISYESDAAVQLVGNNGTDALVVDTSHNLSYNGTNITPTAGTYTATFSTGCTTTPTFTVHYSKFGPLVHLWAANAGALLFTPCTVNSTNRATDASMPAALRPATSKSVGLVSFDGSGAMLTACLTINSTGTLQWGQTATFTTACRASVFNNSSTTAPDEFAVTYDVN